MSQSRYGDGSTGGRRIVERPEPVDKAFGLPGLSALRTSAKTVGMAPTAQAVGSIAKPKVVTGLRSLTKTPARTAGTIGGSLVLGNMSGRRSGRNQVYSELGKGLSSGQKKAALHATGGLAAGFTAGGAAGYNRGVRRGIKTEKRRAAAPDDMKALWGGEYVGKAYQTESDRQRRLGMYEAGLGIAGVAAGAAGIKGIRQTTKASRAAAKFTASRTSPAGKATHAALRRGVTARPRDIALVGGGGAALGGAGAVHSHAKGRRGRAWN